MSMYLSREYAIMLLKSIAKTCMSAQSEHSEGIQTDFKQKHHLSGYICVLTQNVNIAI